LFRVSIFEFRVFVNADRACKWESAPFLIARRQLPVIVAIIPKSNEMISCTVIFYGYVENMDWQQLVALAIVATAAGMLVRSRFQRRRFSFERDTHCGCAASGSSAPQGSIVFRARKGERPEVHVKMR
jgi:hypothetical protein